VAARLAGRRFVGYDADPAYVAAAAARVASLDPPIGRTDLRTLKEIALASLGAVGFTDVRRDVRLASGATVSFRATDAAGRPVLFELAGGHTSVRPGLSRIEVVWRAIAKAALAATAMPGVPFVVLTEGRVRGGPLPAVVGGGRPIAAVVDLLDDPEAALARLAGMTP
jgi:site-specific DNA-methyltransferase (adenine-specific)